MQDPKFEKRVQRMMVELKFSPSPDVWDRVEAEINRDQKKKRFILWWIFFGLLIQAIKLKMNLKLVLHRYGASHVQVEMNFGFVIQFQWQLSIFHNSAVAIGPADYQFALACRLRPCSEYDARRLITV